LRLRRRSLSFLTCDGRILLSFFRPDKIRHPRAVGISTVPARALPRSLMLFLYGTYKHNKLARNISFQCKKIVDTLVFVLKSCKKPEW
jgi:hypothetical protein